MEYTWRERALMSEHLEVEALLGEALGYKYDEQYGWVTGDHTIVTLAMEVRSRGVLPAKVPESKPRDRTLESTTWMCPYCRDHYGPDDEDQPPVCDMCKKAGRSS